jgi:CheY-like chemotaxis protein
MNREVLAAFLAEAGLTWEMAEDGAGAMAALATGRPFHAVLLDLQLPDTNGLELAPRLREQRPGLPVVAVTAQADAGTREACLAAGFSGVVTKPIQPDLLMSAIALAVGAPDRPGAGWTPPPALAGAPLLTEVFADEPERLQRVLRTLSGEFDAAATELNAAVDARDSIRLGRLRHKLHSAVAGLGLTALDEAFSGLLAGDWAQAPAIHGHLQEAARDCAEKADRLLPAPV